MILSVIMNYIGGMDIFIDLVDITRILYVLNLDVIVLHIWY